MCAVFCDVTAGKPTRLYCKSLVNLKFLYTRTPQNLLYLASWVLDTCILPSWPEPCCIVSQAPCFSAFHQPSLARMPTKLPRFTVYYRALLLKCQTAAHLQHVCIFIALLGRPNFLGMHFLGICVHSSTSTDANGYARYGSLLFHPSQYHGVDFWNSIFLYRGYFSKKSWSQMKSASAWRSFGSFLEEAWVILRPVTSSLLALLNQVGAYLYIYIIK